MSKKKIIILSAVTALAIGLAAFYFLSKNPPKGSQLPNNNKNYQKREELNIPKGLLERLTKKGVIIKITPQ